MNIVYKLIKFFIFFFEQLKISHSCMAAHFNHNVLRKELRRIPTVFACTKNIVRALFIYYRLKNRSEQCI